MDLTELKHLQRLILSPILLTVHLVLIYTLIKELIALSCGNHRQSGEIFFISFKSTES
jgi:hypothetical protein